MSATSPSTRRSKGRQVTSKEVDDERKQEEVGAVVCLLHRRRAVIQKVLTVMDFEIPNLGTLIFSWRNP
ncbi:unnamed protein product [Linum trigynum]|uniref:Uncharacterized protein n=1 Tax=Linum trigynum TaxID=586398 RepID=A0AAV2CC42_9ROSI